MKPYLLKRDILYRAIQGKLVPQLISEGTGRSLLEENNNKKASFPTDIQKRIGKACKPILETELLFDIPETWEWERFGNLVINYDSQRKPVTKSDRKSIKGLYDYYGATGAIDKVDEFIFNGEYLMIGEDGGNFFVDRDNSFIAKGAFWANNHVHVVKPITCDINYLKVCLDAYDLPNLGLINGIAVPKLNQENMNSILVPVPPLAEQKRIVAKIEELLPLIDRYEKAWTRLEDFNKRFPGDMQKSILQMAIQGKLVDQRPEEGTGEELYQQIQKEKQVLIKAGKIKKEKPLPEITEEEIPFDIPETWKWVMVGAVCMNIQYGSSQKSSPSGKIPVLRMGNIQNGRIVYDKLVYTSDDTEIDKYPLAVNDLLFNRTNSKELVGKTAIYKGEMPAIYAGYLVRVTPVLLDSDYLNFVMQSQYYWTYCQTVRSDAIGQSNINAEKLKRFIFPLPPLAEQKRIVARLEELLPLCEKLK